MNRYFLTITLFFTLVFTGCIHKIDTNGLTISITSQELNNSLSKSFPYEKQFIVGEIKAFNPKLTLSKKDNRVYNSLNLSFTVLASKIEGSFKISGEPYFKKDKRQIFLKNLKIEELDFIGINGTKELPLPFIEAVNSMMNEFFKDYPIYEIPKNSFENYFIKDMKIEDSLLLITYGI